MGLLTPFLETALSGNGSERRFRLGTRFEAYHADMTVELAGERLNGAAGEAEQTIKLRLRLRF